jgi:hypothetical protein
MFGILADVIRIATRQDKPRRWTPPGHWTLPEEEERPAHDSPRRVRDQRRRWLRDTGIL